MKRRFVECAVLLGIVMSVMLLAQTQDVIGHDKAPGHTGSHTHDPSIRVDWNGYPAQSGGEDPRGNLYVGGSGWLWSQGCASSWGMRYYGGNYTTNVNDRSKEKQNVYSLRIDTAASANGYTCSGSVSPSISGLDFYPESTGNWQGVGSISLSFDCISYHIPRYTWGWGRRYSHCEEIEVEESACDPDPYTHVISVHVNTANIVVKRSTSLTIGVSGTFVNASGNITNGSEVTFNDVLYARGFGIEAALGHEHNSVAIDYLRWGAEFDGIGNPAIEKQTKYASAIGHLSDYEVETPQAIAMYSGSDTHECPEGSGSGSN